MGVPYTFGGQVGNVNASELDADFNYLTAGATGGSGGGVVYGTGGGGTGSTTGVGLEFFQGTVGGTANALTLTTSVVPTALSFGQFYIVVPIYTNTGAATININGTGALPIEVEIAGNFTALRGGELSLNCGIRLWINLFVNTYFMERINDGNYWALPQNSQSANYTTVMADAGASIYHPSADTNARTWTIDSNVDAPYPIGTAITFINDVSAGTITIAITSDTLVLFPAGSTGSRTLAAGGMATAVKVTATRWVIQGTNLT